MIQAAPLRRDLWARTGRPGGNAGLRGDAGWDMWRRNPSMNPSLQKATEDDVWLAELDRRNQLAQRLQAQQGGMKARSDADLLEQALNSGNVNIHAEPQNEFDEQIQGIMQGHINAGIRGQNAQFSQSVQDRIRRRQLENLQAQRLMRDQALDQAKFADQKKRQGQQFALDVAKQQQQQRYRDGLVKQRQQQMAYDMGKDKDATYRKDAQMALELVRDGMDPEEVTQLFKLDDRDQQLLYSFAGAADDQVAAEEEPILQFLNDREMGMRQPIEVEEPGWWDRMRGNVPQGPAFSDAPERVRTQAPGMDDANFAELREMAAENGFLYDPQQGFIPARGATPPPAEITQPRSGSMSNLGGRKQATDPSLPLITSKAQLEEMIRTGRLRRGMKFRTMSGYEKIVN